MKVRKFLVEYITTNHLLGESGDTEGGMEQRDWDDNPFNDKIKEANKEAEEALDLPEEEPAF